MSTHPEDRPVDLGDVPAEEDISAADAAERVDEDPYEQANFTEDLPKPPPMPPPD